MIKTWQYDRYGKPHTFTVDTEKRTFEQTETAGSIRNIDVLFSEYGYLYYHAGFGPELFRLLAESTPFPQASLRERWTVLFWKRFTGAPCIEIDLPTHCLQFIATKEYLGSQYKYEHRTGDLVLELWSDWLWNGNRMPGLPLEVRKQYRNLMLETVPELRQEAEKKVFPLIDYLKIPQRSWQESCGIEGDRLRFGPDAVYLEGWDNPRDGGGQTYSYESLLMHPEQHIWRHLKPHRQEIISLVQAAVIEPVQDQLPLLGGRKTDV